MNSSRRGKPGASAREVEMALKLVREMSEKWKPEKYHHTCRDDLLAGIRKKVKAGKTADYRAAPHERLSGKARGCRVL